MSYKDWTTTPVLACLEIEETLTFWEHLGFEVTYRQTRPYQYGVVARNGHELHFVRTKGYAPTTCLMMVGNVQQVHEDFCSSMKTQLGRVPQSGVPRISRMKPGQSRFTLTDLAGNSIICIQIGEEEQPDAEDATPLQQSLILAIRLRDFKEDYVAAAKILDTAYRKSEKNEKKPLLAEALIIRSELARVLGDKEKQAECDNLINLMGIQEDILKALKDKHYWRDK